MSYVRFDDEHENGRLTQFRERLSGEVRIQTGEAFDIFQDRKDIAWGQQWKRRIEESIDTVTFLIPVLTPAFFRSPACRGELERFLRREKDLGRSDLILPLYYVECAVLTDEVKLELDPLAKAIADRQYADWRELRFEPFTSPEVGRRLAGIARQIVKALERDEPGIVQPRLRADTDNQVQRPAGAAPRSRWTEEKFRRDAQRRLDAAQFIAVEKLLDWSKQHAPVIAWGNGKDRGTFSVRFPVVSPSKSVLTVFSDGTLNVNFGWLVESEAARACAQTLVDCVRSLGLAEVPENYEKKYPNIHVDVWKGKLEEITQCFERAVEAARQVSARSFP